MMPRSLAVTGLYGRMSGSSSYTRNKFKKQERLRSISARGHGCWSGAVFEWIVLLKIKGAYATMERTAIMKKRRVEGTNDI